MLELFLDFFCLAKRNEKGQYCYIREIEGPWSWQHITLVSICLAIMFALAIYIGRKNKDKSEQEKNKVLIFTAFLINGFELVKIIMLSIRYEDVWYFRYVLPLFLCSVQLIAIPMAAFCKGRLREACLDFVFTFGILGALFGTVGATQIYSRCPVISMDAVFSAITHSISGFASLYIGISGMKSMKNKNLPITVSVLCGISVVAYIANHIVGYNYMFLMSHDGTPYSIFYNMVGGSPVLYPLVVVGIFVLYLVGFYAVDGWIEKRKEAATVTEVVEAVPESTEEDKAA